MARRNCSRRKALSSAIRICFVMKLRLLPLPKNLATTQGRGVSGKQGMSDSSISAIVYTVNPYGQSRLARRQPDSRRDGGATKTVTSVPSAIEMLEFGAAVQEGLLSGPRTQGEGKAPSFAIRSERQGSMMSSKAIGLMAPDAMGFGQIVNEQAGNDSVVFDAEQFRVRGSPHIDSGPRATGVEESV